MRPVLLLIHRLADHPIMSTAISLLLFLGALTETVSTFQQDVQGANFRAHHGLLVFAGVQILGAGADALQSFLEFTEHEEEEEGEEHA